MRAFSLGLALLLAIPAAAVAAPPAITPVIPDPPPPPPHGPPPRSAVTVLHLTQTATRRLVRDLLHADLRVEKSGADPQAVEAAINQSMAKALAEARKVQGVEVETGSYSVYREELPNRPPVWRGSQSLRLASSDSALLLRLAGQLQGAGLAMSDLEYEASPEEVRGAEVDLTADALSALAMRAAAIARQLHLRVLRYRKLTVGNAETSGPPMPRFALQAKAAMPTPVAAPGKATVRVTIDAEILLAPRP